MAVAPFASLTWTVKEDVPAAVGVPLMTPVFVLSVRPGGSDPAMSEKTSGGTPPVATKEAVKGLPTTPLPPEHNRAGPGIIVMLQVRLVVSLVAPVESVTLAVYGKLPAAVGVPVMAPVFVFSIKPGGNEPEIIEKLV